LGKMKENEERERDLGEEEDDEDRKLICTFTY
jgi:hypothetical protein